MQNRNQIKSNKKKKKKKKKDVSACVCLALLGIAKVKVLLTWYGKSLSHASYMDVKGERLGLSALIVSIVASSVPLLSRACFPPPPAAAPPPLPEVFVFVILAVPVPVAVVLTAPLVPGGGVGPRELK